MEKTPDASMYYYDYYDYYNLILLDYYSLIKV